MAAPAAPGAERAEAVGASKSVYETYSAYKERDAEKLLSFYTLFHPGSKEADFQALDGPKFIAALKASGAPGASKIRLTEEETAVIVADFIERVIRGSSRGGLNRLVGPKLSTNGKKAYGLLLACHRGVTMDQPNFPSPFNDDGVNKEVFCFPRGIRHQLNEIQIQLVCDWYMSAPASRLARTRVEEGEMYARITGKPAVVLVPEVTPSEVDYDEMTKAKAIDAFVQFRRQHLGLNQTTDQAARQRRFAQWVRTCKAVFGFSIDTDVRGDEVLYALSDETAYESLATAASSELLGGFMNLGGVRKREIVFGKMSARDKVDTVTSISTARAAGVSKEDILTWI